MHVTLGGNKLGSAHRPALVQRVTGLPASAAPTEHGVDVLEISVAEPDEVGRLPDDGPVVVDPNGAAADAVVTALAEADQGHDRAVLVAGLALDAAVWSALATSRLVVLVGDRGDIPDAAGVPAERVLVDRLGLVDATSPAQLGRLATALFVGVTLVRTADVATVRRALAVAERLHRARSGRPIESPAESRSGVTAP